MGKKISAKAKNIIGLIVAVVTCELVGIAGSVFTASSVGTWYAGIVKPPFNPPLWVFAPVWTALFLLMGIASFLIWKKGLKKKNVKVALIVFGAQLVLNLAWSLIFFGFHSISLAFAEIIILWIAILATGILFYKISKPAALLLLPYLIWVGFAGYLNFSLLTLNSGEINQEVICTLEARLCSDGSAVGRTGPNCEFAECPGNRDTIIWKTYTDEAGGISFEYPISLLTSYIHEVDWPPVVNIIDESFSCLNAGNEIDRAGKTEGILINGREYCVTKVSEGAAGSIYTQYAFAVPRGEKTAIFTFTLRSVQCLNYDEPKTMECQNEQESFDINPMLDRMAESLEIK